MAYHINISEFTQLMPTSLYQYTEARIIDLTDNSNFKTMTPSLTVMETANALLSRSEAIHKKTPNSVTEKNRDEAYEAVLSIHKQWIAQIEKAAGDDLYIIMSTGYKVEGLRVTSTVPQGTPPAPKVKPTVNIGSVRLSVKPYKQNNARIIYNWEISTDGINFQNLPYEGGSSRRTVSGLELNKTYWFRVSYGTTAGSGAPSEAVEIILTKSLTDYGHKVQIKKGKARLISNGTVTAPPPEAAQSSAAKKSQ